MTALTCEHVPFSQIAEQFGTPVYVYSQAALTEAFQAYTDAFSELDTLVCYAVKANGNLSILKHFAGLGSGFDIVSGGELARVLAAGGDAGKTIFSGVGKSEAEIGFALEAGVKCFNVESLPELDRINAVAERLGKTAPISLRVNPDVDAKTHPYISTGLKANKFGIAYTDALEAYRYASALGRLKIVGIDCHIGSQLTDLSPLAEACERILLLVDRLAEEGIALQHIDLGGGIGIVYRDEDVPDLKAYADNVAKQLAGRGLKLILEPGRSLVGNAGTLLTRVEFVKQGEEKNFIIVDAAMNDLMRPSLYEAYHHIEAVEPRGSEAVEADVVGPICETGDFLGKDRKIACEAGDLLAIRSAGAYAMSMASNYNTRNRAAEVMVADGEVKLIRKRETLEQQLENEKACL
ncbi:diaminopimelate decarboxylase [Neisseria weaveri]|uniref:Diaminopimelate decarboxylase n=1 Tax=Neisseria weaveri TaxID=28091 RepID=A0A3S4ZLD8_9NEIS|nr:diaminopimelate decarboxylase [Neisseria weaveri]EGV34893.1 diaminopimelate decarboxylase [Neisseria weaveri LMG 5135]EGV37964.1 diaminopimelate decarboxylase [Neisseria weaveri ATCC 51223]VEJ51095.1 diaminopimelate decarboxylase [Neisseria weaveri]